jgi:hypothetical protein
MFEHIFDGVPNTAFVSVMTLVNGENRIFNYVQVEQFIKDANLYAGRSDIYYGPAPRKTPGDTIEDCLGTRVLWADVQQEQPRATLPPSIVVHSGGGWHFYWMLNTFVSSPEKVADLNISVRDDLEGDAVQNINRFLRIPGTFNAKKSPLRPVEIRMLRPTLVYSPVDFQVLGLLDSKTKHKIRTGDTRGYSGDRSRRDWAIITELVRAGASDDLIRIIYTHQPCGDKYRDKDTNGEEYLLHTLEKIRARPTNRVQMTNIVETPTGYLAIGAKGDKRLSTFIIKPKMLLMGDKQDAIVGDVVTEDYSWPDVTFPREAFNDRKSFDKYLRVSAWSWFGKDDDVRYLLPHLLDQLKNQGLPKTRATSVLGRHGSYFVGPVQTIHEGVVYEGTDAPMAYLDTGKTQLPIRYPVGDVDVSLLTSINEPCVVWPIIGWFMATPYKPILETMGVRFPILDVFGTKGSGKTSIIRTFQRLLGYQSPLMTDCKTTRFVMLSLLGMSNSIPIALSEFRQSYGEAVTRFVLLGYDTGHDARGRGDQTITEYALSAPFSVDGEDIIGDPAAKERIVAVPLHPEMISENTDCYVAFMRLQGLDLELFAAGYIMHTLKQDVASLYKYAVNKVQESFLGVLPTRVRSNLTVAALGIYSFCNYTKIPEPNLKEVLAVALSTVWNVDMGRGSTLVDLFVERIVNAVSMNEARFFFRVKDNVMWFQLSTAFDYWMRQRRAVNLPTLDRDAIRIQLVERYMTRGGKGQYIREGKVVEGCWCYGIDLEKAVASGLDIPDRLDLSSLIVHIKR